MTLEHTIPAALKLSVCARVLDLHEQTLRGWADRGDLETTQLRPGAMRYVPTQEVIRIAQKLGLTPHWEFAL